MNSTDRTDQLRRFYRERMLPVAIKLSERNLNLLVLAPETDSDTWYVSTATNEPEFIEFDEEHFGSQMRDLWEAQGYPEISELAEPLAELAREMELGEDESSEVSPFIYVMF